MLLAFKKKTGGGVMFCFPVLSEHGFFRPASAQAYTMEWYGTVVTSDFV